MLFIDLLSKSELEITIFLTVHCEVKRYGVKICFGFIRFSPAKMSMLPWNQVLGLLFLISMTRLLLALIALSTLQKGQAFIMLASETPSLEFASKNAFLGSAWDSLILRI